MRILKNATALLIGVAFGLLWGAGAVLKHESSQVPSLWAALGTGLITGVDFALGAWLFRWSRSWFRSVLVSNPRLAAQKAESAAARDAIETGTAECSAAEAEMTAIADQRSNRLTTISALETELRRIRSSLNDLRDLRSKQEVRQTQLQLRIDNLVEHASRRYQVDLRGFESDSYAFRKTLQAQLKRRATGADPVRSLNACGFAFAPHVVRLTTSTALPPCVTPPRPR